MTKACCPGASAARPKCSRSPHRRARPVVETARHLQDFRVHIVTGGVWINVNSSGHGCRWAVYTDTCIVIRTPFTLNEGAVTTAETLRQPRHSRLCGTGSLGDPQVRCADPQSAAPHRTPPQPAAAAVQYSSLSIIAPRSASHIYSACQVCEC